MAEGAIAFPPYLLEKQLPQIILDRHQNTVDRYCTEFKQLMDELEAVTGSSSNQELPKVSGL